MKMIFLGVSFSFVISLNAQVRVADVNTINSDGLSNLYGFYYNNGRRVSSSELADVKGTPFLRNDWGYGVIRLRNGKEREDTAMNYSLYDEKLFYIQNEKLFVISDPIREFEISFLNEAQQQEKFLFRTGYPEANKNTANTIYQVLYSGINLQLLKWQQKTIIENNTYGSVKTKEFLLLEKLYLFDAQNFKTIEINATINSIKNALPQYYKSIDFYLQKTKVNPKNTNELIGLITYVDANKK